MNSNNFFDTNWNVVINIGTNCDVMWISKHAEIRYFSSPFDSIETTTGLIPISELIANKFDGYMEDRNDWELTTWGSYRVKRTKNIKNEAFSTLNYVHIHHNWLPGISRHSWKVFRNTRNPASDAWNVDSAWERFKTTFHNRQQRLVSLLESENKVLFLRLENSNHKFVWPNNTQLHCDTFVKNIKKAYPNANFGYYHLYHSEDGRGKQREPILSSCDEMYIEAMPKRLDATSDRRKRDYKKKYRQAILKKLSKIKLLPRDEILPFDFEEKIFYKK